MKMDTKRPVGAELSAPETLLDSDFVTDEPSRFRARYVVLPLALGGIGYFVSTASTTISLIVGGVVLAIGGLLVYSAIAGLDDEHFGIGY